MLLKAGVATAVAVLTVAVFIAATTAVIATAWSTLTSPTSMGGSGGAPDTDGRAAASDGATPGAPATGGSASPAALADIPGTYLGLYQRAAATCPGLSWTVLAAIGKVESDHGRSTLPGVRDSSNSAGAMGPMQFQGPTFAQYANPVPPGGANPPSPYDPTDAIYAAGRMLCRNGAANGTDLPAALFAYNHSTAYVSQVLAQARRYQTGAATSTAPNGSTPRRTPPADLAPTSTSPPRAAATAVAYAQSQVGMKYVWGGNGGADGGFDCSGLTTAAYAAAGITLPRTAQTQYNAGPRLPTGSTPQLGDLVFFGAGPSAVTHVGIATSPTTMIDAPDVGTLVRQDPIARNLVGVSRPSQLD